MSPSRYEELLHLVGSLITKNAHRREVISPGERLCIKLRYLCSGDSNITIACSYRVGISTVGKIITETCIAIWKTLLAINCIKAPESKEEWLKIAFTTGTIEHNWHWNRGLNFVAVELNAVADISVVADEIVAATT